MVTSSDTAGTEPLWRALTALFTVLLALLVAHDVDHVLNEERLYELTPVFWVFLPIQYAVVVAVVTMVCRRNSQAPTLAAALAAIVVLGFIVSHVLPFGLAPYEDGSPNALNWALVFVPMGVALAALAVAARLREMERPARPAEASRA